MIESQPSGPKATGYGRNRRWLSFLSLGALNRLKRVKQSGSRVQRHAEAVLQKAYPGMMPESDEMGDQNYVESPVTHNHYHAEKKAALLGPWAKTALAVALGAGAVAAWPYVVDWLNRQPTIQPVPTPGKTVIKTVPGKDTDVKVKGVIIRE